MERSNSELLTATRMAEVVYRTLCKSWMHGELCSDITKTFTAVFYTTHNAPSAPAGPFQENTLQYTENDGTFIKQLYGSHRQKQGQQPALN